MSRKKLTLLQKQREKIKKDRQAWTEIKTAYKASDIIQFFRLYVQYLDYQNVISERRRMLRNTMDAVVNLADEEQL